jgi:FMN-dependent NADH-azoreductase
VRWLHVEASPRGARSRSSRLAWAFLLKLADRRPGLEVTRWNLFEDTLPELDQHAIEARYAVLAGEADPAALASWEGVRATHARVVAHDALIISTPMWNWGVPYRLKQWIDLITHPGLAFRVGPAGDVEGLLGPRPTVVATASALAYQGPAASLDHQVAYLRDWLAFVGLGDAAFVHAAPMYGTVESVEAAFGEAQSAAEALAEGFQHRGLFGASAVTKVN